MVTQNTFVELHKLPFYYECFFQLKMFRQAVIIECSPTLCLCQVPSRNCYSSPEHQKLGEMFVTWFYRLLNSENAAVSALSEMSESFGQNHFWPSCSLKLVTLTPNQSEETFEGNVLVSERLRAFAREEHLLFNPNVSTEGVKTQSDPHGLVIVMACGTIHQHDNCLGIFQQMFGLVRDPTNDNNWKIKMSQLRIMSSHVTAIPKLTDLAANDLLGIANHPMSNAIMPHT